MVPNGWVVKNLDSIYRVIDSLHQTPSFSKDGEYRMVRVTDIKGKNLDLSNAVRVSKEVFLEYTKKYKPKRNDILFSRVGSYGISSFVDTDQEFCLGQNTVIAESNDQANPIYIFNVLKSEGIRRQVEKTVDGSSHKTVSLKVIKYLKIPLAPRKEQNKIAQILSTWDQAISATEKLLENSQQQKKALMQQLLTGQKRLLDENGERFSGDWNKVSIASTFKLITDYVASGSFATLKENVVVSEQVGFAHYVRQTDLAANFKNSTLKWVDEESYNFLKKSNLYQGDILFTNIGDLGKVYYMPALDKPATVAPNLVVLRVNTTNYSKFIYYLLASEVGQREVNKIKSGTGLPKISKTEFKTMLFNIPPFEEQKRIAAIISTADSEIEVLHRKLDCLKQEKKALMQQLLTGKKRVKVAA